MYLSLINPIKPQNESEMQIFSVNFYYNGNIWHALILRERDRMEKFKFIIHDLNSPYTLHTNNRNYLGSEIVTKSDCII